MGDNEERVHVPKEAERVCTVSVMDDVTRIWITWDGGEPRAHPEEIFIPEGATVLWQWQSPSSTSEDIKQKEGHCIEQDGAPYIDPRGSFTRVQREHAAKMRALEATLEDAQVSFTMKICFVVLSPLMLSSDFQAQVAPARDELNAAEATYFALFSQPL